MDLNFNDFKQLDIKFDINKLQDAYKEVIKIKNFESPEEITNFGAISLTQIPGDPDSIKGHKARGVFGQNLMQVEKKCLEIYLLKKRNTLNL